MLNSSKIMNTVAKPLTFFNKLDPIAVGDSAVLNLANENIRLRRNELQLTCYESTFCHYEIKLAAVLSVSASRV